MKTNTATNQGIYLGQGISPFPQRHAFARNEDGSNKRFLYSLEGVVEIPARELQEKMQAEMRGMESYYQAYPNTPLDWKKIEKKPWQPLRKQPFCNSLKTNELRTRARPASVTHWYLASYVSKKESVRCFLPHHVKQNKNKNNRKYT